MVGVFLAEGCYQGPRRGFFTRSGKVANFRESKFKLGVIEGEPFQEINTVSVFKEEMYFSRASREEDEPKVVSIGPDKDVVDWFIVTVSFPRDVPKKELLGARFDDIIQLIFYEVVEVLLIEGGSELKEVVEVAGDSRGFGTALYSGFSTEIYPVFFRVEVIELSKTVCFEKFLGLKMACLLSKWQAQSV